MYDVFTPVLHSSTASTLLVPPTHYLRDQTLGVRLLSALVSGRVLQVEDSGAGARSGLNSEKSLFGSAG